jgi:hypothetical protein
MFMERLRPMIYVKSFLAGLAAVIVAALIVGAVFFGFPLLKLLLHRDEGGIGVIEVGPFVHLWPFPIGASIIFAGAFYWAFRRGRAN